jgi:hypothetical protein
MQHCGIQFCCSSTECMVSTLLKGGGVVTVYVPCDFKQNCFPGCICQMLQRRMSGFLFKYGEGNFGASFWLGANKWSPPTICSCS